MGLLNKVLLFVLGIASFSLTAYAEKYTFSAIDGLPDQAIGVLVMKEVYKQIGHELDERSEYYNGIIRKSFSVAQVISIEGADRKSFVIYRSMEFISYTQQTIIHLL